MVSALIEAFAEAFDTLFKKHPRLGSVLKLIIICVVASFLWHVYQSQAEKTSENDKQQNTNFETIANQNRQLLNILEAQNELFSDRIEVLESRQYVLQRELVSLIKENEHIRNKASVAETAPVSKAEPSTVLTALPTDARSAEITESINVLKSQMSSESTDAIPIADEQTQQPAGN